ncbi:type II CAAX endopeptidase family protein [Microbacterium sp. NPDC089189]|uniref:CPBP family intramembrane glutamic endopeptidase n=1 Tax=Microbacterium sp. NPDC089189 TaxID=3154972 RepID=UPI003424BCF3
MAALPFAQGMGESRRPTGIVLGTLVVVAITACLFPAGALWRHLLPAPFFEAAGVAAVTPVFLIAWLLLWLWLRGKEQRPFASLGFRQPSLAAPRIARGAAIALAQLGVYLAIGVATGNLVFATAPTGGLVHWSAWGLAAIALVAFAAQSGAEEILARGYLVQVWYPRTGVIGAVVVSAAYFTLAHTPADSFTVLPMIDMTLYSVLAVLWVLGERGLWGIIGYHAMWNWAQNSLFGIAVSGEPAPSSLFVVTPTAAADTTVIGADYGAEGSLIDIGMLLVLIAGAVVILLRRRARARRAAEERSRA